MSAKKTYRPGLNISPYVLEGQDPNLGSCISKSQIEDLLQIVSPYTDWVRFFGMSHGLEHGCEIAHSIGLKTAVGVWLSRDMKMNDQQISRTISVVKAHKPEMVIVGSETLLRCDLHEEQLIKYINTVRAEIPSGTVVTTADDQHSLVRRPKLLEHLDLVMANIYPYFTGMEVEMSMLVLDNMYRQLAEASNGKEVMISETGWPSKGQKRKKAISSPENAAYHFLLFASWAQAKNVRHFYFEAFDEPWKARYEGEQGSFFGLWDKNLMLKPGMLDVFDGKVLNNIEELSSIPFHQKRITENLPLPLKILAKMFAK